jgi:hypothetical protein
MNKFSFSFLLLLFISCEGIGQSEAKPRFAELESASYEKSNTGILTLTDYLKIDSAGKVEMLEIYHSDTTYYNFQLPESVFAKVKEVYGSKSLKSYMIQDRLAKGVNYAGDYSFAALRRVNDKIEHLTYIVPFMEPKFHEGRQAIYNFYFQEKKKLNGEKFKISESFLQDLNNNHRLTKNLPDKVLPPAEMPPPGN